MQNSTATETRTFIARHSARYLESGRCTRRAYRFEASFVVEVLCPDCGARMGRIDTVEGIQTEDKDCNQRCMGATTGGVCECRCGGSNHGGRWA